MRFSENDINNYTGIGIKVLDLKIESEFKEFINTIANRAVSIGHVILTTKDNALTQWNSENNELSFYEEIAEGLFKNTVRFKIDTTEATKVAIIEKALIQGYQEDENGNISSADVVGIEVLFGEYEEGIDEAYFDDCDEDMLYDNFDVIDWAIKRLQPSDTYLSF